MSMRVLIADPDWRFARRVAAFLESRAHLVVRHHYPSEVMEAVRNWSPNLVIISEEFATSGLIDQLHSLSPRPAVLLVGWMDRVDKIWRAWQRGGDEILMKPVLKSIELQQAIVTAMENAAANLRARPASVPA